MTFFFTILVASAIGTFCGNLGLFWLIGNQAQRMEKQQREELEKLQQGFLEARQKEIERMQRYAKMEG